VPTVEEVKEYLGQICAPDFTFEWRPFQMLRVNVPDRIIYCDPHFMLSAIETWEKRTWDWHKAVLESIKHEKGHVNTYRLVEQGALTYKELDELGLEVRWYHWLTSYLADWVVDTIYYRDDEQYQRFFIEESIDTYRHWAKLSRKERRHAVNLGIPYMMSVAFHYARGVVTTRDIWRDFPEYATLILKLGDLLKGIEKQEDLPPAIRKGVEILVKEM